MANKACDIFPLAGKNNETSKLYKELDKFTTGDRRLTNFLYGIALNVVDTFDKKDINSQGEPNMKAFIKKYDLDKFIATNDEVRREREDIGAIDASGELIKHDDPNDIRDTVYEYNKTHNRFKARVEFKDDGYVINLDRTNAGNFRNNEVMDSNTAKFTALSQYLASIGLNTDFSDASIHNMTNYVFARMYETFALGLRQSAENLTVVQAGVLLDLFKDESPFVARLLAEFGSAEETATAISDTSSHRSNPKVTIGNSMLINDFLTHVQKFFDAKFDSDAYDVLLTGLQARVTPSTEEFLTVQADVLNMTLQELYDTYNINLDVQSESKQALKKLSEVVERMYSIELQRFEIEKVKTGKNPDGRALASVQKMIEARNYSRSAFAFLESLLNELTEISDTFKAGLDALKNLSGSENMDLAKLKAVASQINSIKELVNAYKEPVVALMRADELTLDQPGLTKDFIEALKGTATRLNGMLDTLQQEATNHQFDVVYSWLKLYWGDTDERTMSSGETRSLTTIVQTMQNDPGFFDRYIRSINETSDAGLNLIHQAIKQRHRAMERVLRDVEFTIRQVTDEFIKKGGDPASILEYDKDKNPTGYFKSYIDYEKYQNERDEFKKQLHDKKVRGRAFREELRKWEKAHTVREHKPFDWTNTRYIDAFNEYYEMVYGEKPMVQNPVTGAMEPATYTIAMVPDPKQYHSDAYDNLTEAQKEYYDKMLALKAVLTAHTPDALGLFTAVQMSSDWINSLKKNGGNPLAMLKEVKASFGESLRNVNNPEEITFADVLEANEIATGVRGLSGQELPRIPIFYTGRLKNVKRLSTDVSGSMVAYATAAMQYYEMDKILDLFLLTDDWFRHGRELPEKRGGNTLMDLFEFGRKTYARSVTKTVDNTNEGGILSDLYEKEFLGRSRKGGGTVTIFGKQVNTANLVDVLTGATSRWGLTVNLFGAEANLLVGKIQMFIESHAGEFFDLKDAAVAELEYFKHLVSYLNEYASNNKKSFLYTLGARFDIMEDYLQELKSMGFHTSNLGKILGNTNLFMLYRMGEHLLHFTGALAVMHNRKVYDTQTGNEVPFLEALERSYEAYMAAHPNDANAKFSLDTKRYQWIDYEEKSKIKRAKLKKEGKPVNKTYRPIREEDVERVERDIAYVNKSMHGAFNSTEKGFARRYAFGRLVMNFRQWMPAHYNRRFAGLHYDADLMDDREGFYNSGWKFLRGCVEDLFHGQVQIGTRWSELSDLERYNMQRIFAEIETLVLLSIANLSLGSYKDKRGNWAYRNLMYEVKRMLLEVKASTPIPDIIPLLAGDRVNLMSFTDNIWTMINSPIAAISTIKRLSEIINITDMFLTIEGGQYDGENRWWHNFKKDAPYYGQLRKMKNLGEEDYMFQMFNE